MDAGLGREADQAPLAFAARGRGDDECGPGTAAANWAKSASTEPTLPASSRFTGDSP